MTITSQLFEAFLKCPTKCWLRARDESSLGGTYDAWVHEQNESYRADSVRRLTVDLPVADYAVSPQAENLKSAQWRLAVDVLVSAAIGAEAQFPGESRIHAVERVPAAGRGNRRNLFRSASSSGISSPKTTACCWPSMLGCFPRRWVGKSASGKSSTGMTMQRRR